MALFIEQQQEEALLAWLESPPGRLLLEQEQACLSELMSKLFGYYLVQIGSFGGKIEPEAASRPIYRLLVASTMPATYQPGWIRGLPDELPVASDSVDVVLLPHTLDFCQDPHRVLREAERILIPEGHLIVSGFNPWGLWGVWRLLYRHKIPVPWSGRFLPPYRIEDWLALLGLEVEERRSLLFRPPLRQRLLLNKMSWIEPVGSRWWPALSAFYVLKAVKRVSTLTPVRPSWKLSPSLLGGRVIEPTSRNLRDGLG